MHFAVLNILKQKMVTLSLKSRKNQKFAELIGKEDYVCCVTLMLANSPFFPSTL